LKKLAVRNNFLNWLCTSTPTKRSCVTSLRYDNCPVWKQHRLWCAV